MLKPDLKKILCIFIISLFCLCFSITSMAQPENWPKVLSIGGATVGGGFYMGASAVAKVINDKIPEIKAIVEVTGAAEANCALIKSKDVEIAMVTSNVAWESFNGKGYAEGDPEKINKDIRVVLMGWPDAAMLITLKKYGINKISDFDGKVFSLSTKGSSGNTISKRIFEVLGINVNPVNLSANDAMMALKDGTISGFLLGWPNTSVNQLEAELDVVIVTPNDEELKKILGAYPQYSESAVPAGAYKAVPEAKETFGSYMSIMCHKDLPTDLVYTIVKTMYDNVNIIRTVWPSLANNMDIKVLLDKAKVPLHPGLIQYVREQGFSMPDELIPPEAK